MARNKGTEDVNFSFIEEVKPKVIKGKSKPTCHNGLCIAKARCKTYKGDKEGLHRIKRSPTTCRLYDPKEGTHVRKTHRYR